MKSEPASYNFRMSVLRAVPLAFILTMLATAQQTISFPTEDGGRVCGDLYGQGDRAVVLAHGGRFNKESWKEQAQVLATKGFRILALDFRGFGCSTGPGPGRFLQCPIS
jgi:pimeloyl-ACP methyl ester carboxylesterase